MDTVEPISPKAPEVRDNIAQSHFLVDAGHAGNKVTKRYHTGILLFINRGPIIWYYKRQNTIDTSSFISKFAAMNTAAEMIR